MKLKKTKESDARRLVNEYVHKAFLDATGRDMKHLVSPARAMTMTLASHRADVLHCPASNALGDGSGVGLAVCLAQFARMAHCYGYRCSNSAGFLAITQRHNDESQRAWSARR